MSHEPTNDPRRRRPQRGALIVAALLTLAILAVGIYGWVSLSDVQMDAAGYVALVAGAVFTIALGGGLMALMFYSNRAGYDQRVGNGNDRGKRD